MANRDTIVDFDTDDKIWLAPGRFSGLANQDGHLDKKAFVRGAAATKEMAQIIYNPNTRVLSYDADDIWAGAAEDFAVIGKNLSYFDYQDSGLFFLR